MLLKLIVFGLVFYWLYKIFGGKIVPNEKKDEIELEDTMVECENCSTFVSSKEAIKYKGKFYCCAECLPKGGK
jgi:uncharacterized protein